jgi:hypothetical protein
LPLDWYDAAAAFVITDASLPPTPSTNNVSLEMLFLKDDAGYHPSALARGNWNVLLHCAIHCQVAQINFLEVNATLTATFSLRFGDGGGASNATAPPLALAEGTKWTGVYANCVS